MKYLLVLLILISSGYTDILCQSAAIDVGQYSRDYDDAVDEYEDAESSDKEDAFNEMDFAKSNLEEAISGVFNHCEGREIAIMGQLFEEKKVLKSKIIQLQNEKKVLTNRIGIIKIHSGEKVKIKVLLGSYLEILKNVGLSDEKIMQIAKLRKKQIEKW